jgi:hypothetical protein
LLAIFEFRPGAVGASLARDFEFRPGAVGASLARDLFLSFFKKCNPEQGSLLQRLEITELAWAAQTAPGTRRFRD